MASNLKPTDKEKGNAAFKSGDYPTAIGHYSAAILADRKNPTLPLNRAAAYLKLGKNEDAERDCTIVLSLDTKNVKALFRRGQARVALGALGDSYHDFAEALRLEPANESVRVELEKVEFLLNQNRGKNHKSNSSSMPPKRRRIPIKVIDDASLLNPVANTPEPSTHQFTESARDENNLLQPLFTQGIVPPPTPRSTETSAIHVETETASLQSDEPMLPVPPQSFSAAKHARKEARASRVGGNHFYPSCQQTIIPTRGVVHPSTENIKLAADTPTRASTASKPPTNAISPVTSTYEPPQSLFDFSRVWNSRTSEEERWQILSVLPASGLPSLFQASLEPILLASILCVMKATLKKDPSTGHIVRNLLEGFSNVARFGTLILFLNRNEKEVAREIWDLLGVERPGVWKSIN